MKENIWDKVFSNNTWGKYPPEELIRFITKIFSNVKNFESKKVLEIGCGPGANLWYCAREGFSVYGIDSSKKAIKACKIRLNNEIPNWKGEISVGNIITLPYTNNYFDAIIDIECLYANNIKNSKIAISEIYRTLKKGGYFFSKSFCEGSWGHGTGVKVEKNTFLCSEGPLKDKGLSRFMNLEEIYELYDGFFGDLIIDKLERTTNNQKNSIIEWLIQAKK